MGGLIGSAVAKKNGSTTTGAANNNGGAAGGLMGKAGVLMGSAKASSMAGNGIRTLHRRSVERVAYKKECETAVQMGQPMPAPPDSAAPTDWAAMFQKVKDMAAGGGGASDEGVDDRNDYNTSGTTDNRGTD